jgi:hypothetical protein
LTLFSFLSSNHTAPRTGDPASSGGRVLGQPRSSQGRSPCERIYTIHVVISMTIYVMSEPYIILYIYQYLTGHRGRRDHLFDSSTTTTGSGGGQSKRNIIPHSPNPPHPPTPPYHHFMFSLFCGELSISLSHSLTPSLTPSLTHSLNSLTPSLPTNPSLPPSLQIPLSLK